MSMSSMSERSRTMRSPSGQRVNALKRGSAVGSQSMLSQPSTFLTDGRLSPTPSYATSIDEVSTKHPCPVALMADIVDYCPVFRTEFWIRIQSLSFRHQGTRRRGVFDAFGTISRYTK